MTDDLRIACHCGTVRGTLRAAALPGGSHIVCYCRDCQAFSRHLDPSGSLLDDKGGTEIFQVTPDHLEITEGLDRVACLRLTPQGLTRWYTSCCNTPLGNTGRRPSLPFLGMTVAAVPNPADRARFGPVTLRAFAKQATERVGQDQGSLPGFLWQFVKRVVRARLSGRHRRNPFFNPTTGEPIREPIILREMSRPQA